MKAVFPPINDWLLGNIIDCNKQWNFFLPPVNFSNTRQDDPRLPKQKMHNHMTNEPKNQKKNSSLDHQMEGGGYNIKYAGFQTY